MDERRPVTVHIQDPALVQEFSLCDKPMEKLPKGYSREVLMKGHKFIFCGLCMQKVMEDSMNYMLEEAEEV